MQAPVQFQAQMQGQQIPVQMQGQHNAVPVQMVTTGSKTYSSFPPHTAKALGIIQLIIGVLCFGFQIAAICLGAAVSYVGAGIWAGIMFIIAGSFGIAASSRRIRCLIVTFMVLSIISAVFTIAIITSSSIGLSVDVSCRIYYDGYIPYCYLNRKGNIAMNAVLIALAILEAAASIWSACICCKSSCCCTGTGVDDVRFTPVMMSGASGGNQQVVMIPAGHQIVYQQAPPANHAVTMPSQPVFIMPAANHQYMTAPALQIPQLAGSPPGYYTLPMATNVPGQAAAPEAPAQSAVTEEIAGVHTTDSQKA